MYYALPAPEGSLNAPTVTPVSFPVPPITETPATELPMPDVPVFELPVPNPSRPKREREAEVFRGGRVAPVKGERRGDVVRD